MAAFSLGAFLSAGLGAIVSTFGSEFVKRLLSRNDVLEQSRDADLSRICKEIVDLRKNAADYWSKDAEALEATDAVIAAHIVASQQVLADLVASMFHGRQEKWDCDVHMDAAFRTLTGGEFLSGDRKAEPQRLSKAFVDLARLERHAIEGRRSLPRKWP